MCEIQCGNSEELKMTGEKKEACKSLLIDNDHIDYENLEAEDSGSDSESESESDFDNDGSSSSSSSSNGSGNGSGSDKSSSKKKYPSMKQIIVEKVHLKANEDGTKSTYH